MPDTAKVAHHVRGRLRLHMPAGKRNRKLLENVKKSLSPLPGVIHVDVNPATGSVVVQYEGAAVPDFQTKLEGHGKETGLFDLHPPEMSEVDMLAENIEREAEFLSAHSEAARTVVEAVKDLNLSVRRATNNQIDLKVLLPLGLAVYSLFEIESGISTPLWVTLGMFSFNSFITLHQPAIPEVTSEQIGQAASVTLPPKS
jgi:copper chaperone CopZ